MNVLTKVGIGVVSTIITLALVIVGLIGFVYVDSHVYTGRTEQIWSPDGSTAAYVRLDSMTAGPDEYDVRIRKWYSPLRTSVFSAETHGAKLIVRWADNTHLVIICQHCGELAPYETRAQVSGIRVQYSPEMVR